MTELELIIDLHRYNQRQGPGSDQDTLKALSLIDLPANKPWRVADIGCGTGAQTLSLANNLDGHITAVDLFPEFLEELTNRSEQAGVANMISTLESPMEELPFEKGAYDIIWSEGAIYNMGFEAGIQQWRDYLADGGYLAVSEITWITSSRPQEVEAFWTAEYPEIGAAGKKINQLEKYGYSLVGYFYLSQSSWLDSYYAPLADGFDAFLARHKHSSLAQKVVDDTQSEIGLYQTFKEYYSYGFYIARKK